MFFNRFHAFGSVFSRNHVVALFGEVIGDEFPNVWIVVYQENCCFFCHNLLRITNVKPLYRGMHQDGHNCL